MNWWEREPEPETDEQRRLREAKEAYEQHFGERYAIQFGIDSGTTEELIAKIWQLIETNKKQTLQPYKEGMLY